MSRPGTVDRVMELYERSTRDESNQVPIFVKPEEKKK